MGKIQGSDLEQKMVRAIFKSGGIGFRCPGSGTYKVEDLVIPYTEDQEACKIEIRGIPFVDFGYSTEYITADYVGYFPSNTIGNVHHDGNAKSGEFRIVELKTVRLRKSHLKKDEKERDKKSIDRKTHDMKEVFNLLQTDTRQYVKRKDPNNPKKSIQSPNPYYQKLRKSDFCMELQRIWYLEHLIRKLNIFKCDVRSYLQVRFIGSNKEIWIPISDLAKYQDSTLKEPRDTSSTMLYVIKNEQNIITWEWKRNQSYSFVNAKCIQSD